MFGYTEFRATVGEWRGERKRIYIFIHIFIHTSKINQYTLLETEGSRTIYLLLMLCCCCYCISIILILFRNGISDVLTIFCLFNRFLCCFFLFDKISIISDNMSSYQPILFFLLEIPFFWNGSKGYLNEVFLYKSLIK